MELTIPIKDKDKTKAVLKLLNPFLSNLTDTQISVVAAMIDMNIEVLNKYTRANVRDKIDMDKFTFNNIVGTLKSKRILIQSTVDLRLNPVLKSYTKDDVYTIKFTNA